ncbi:MAG: hypothetical protein B1H12_04465 [Desulfobacteraceae bacterium 4484_190.2]|nr:MAG: hypothetical protein B1H12_04465 [Desulfobacteraceae bacterium 4484_190.2]
MQKLISFLEILRRWQNDKNDRLFREDIRDIQQIRDMAGMQLLSDMLPDGVASLLSVNALREDLEVSHRAVTNWLNILEAFYYCFRIYPFVGKDYRSLKKGPKLYLMDWSEIRDEAKRFENLMASHLLKLVHFLYDYEGYRANLNFLRNVDKKEVDFLVTTDQKPWFAVEVLTPSSLLQRKTQHSILLPSGQKTGCGPARERDSCCFCG